MIKINKISTKPPSDLDKDKCKSKTESLAKKIGELQRIIYAEKKSSVLIIFQGLDASGKGALLGMFSENVV